MDVGKTKKIIPLLSIITGISLILIGLSTILFYIYAVIESVMQADKSGIYWLLPFLFIGLFMAAAGVFILIIGIKSFRSERHYRLAGQSLSVLFILFLISISAMYLSERDADHQRTEWDRLQSKSAKHQKVASVLITSVDETGLDLSIQTVGEIGGSYTLFLKLSNHQAEFKEFYFDLLLNDTENEFQRRITFDDIFSKCFNEFKNSNVYVCTENAGTRNSKFDIIAALKPDQLKEDLFPIDKSSESKTSFYLDTMNENGVVRVLQVRHN